MIKCLGGLGGSRPILHGRVLFRPFPACSGVPQEEMFAFRGQTPTPYRYNAATLAVIRILPQPPIYLKQVSCMLADPLPLDLGAVCGPPFQWRSIIYSISYLVYILHLPWRGSYVPIPSLKCSFNRAVAG